jgi:hypothetical protein
MKVYSKYFLIACASLGLIACQDDESIVTDVLDNTDSGTFLRTRVDEGNPYNAFEPASEWTVTVEVQTGDKTQVVAAVDLYASFQERQFDDDQDGSVGEELVTTFTPGDFTESARGLPEFSYTTTLGETADLLGLSATDYTGGDTFTYRFEVVLEDGRTFSSDDVSATAAGSSYYRSPYAYILSVTCIPTGPVPGEYLLEMQDSFGDGWNGASVRVTVDGVATDYFLDDGSSGSLTIDIPDSAETWFWEFVSGDWDSEITFQIFDPEGNQAFADGPSPVIGEIILSICP